MRCVECGSKDVNRVTKHDGYNYSMKRGLGASLLFGSVGLTAGYQEKTKTVYQCHRCGHESSVVIDGFMESMIDEDLKSKNEKKIEHWKEKYRYVDN